MGFKDGLSDLYVCMKTLYCRKENKQNIQLTNLEKLAQRQTFTFKGSLSIKLCVQEWVGGFGACTSDNQSRVFPLLKAKLMVSTYINHQRSKLYLCCKA